MIKDVGFDILIATHPDYERAVCEIYFNGLYFGLVSQEKSEGIFDLETPAPDLDQSKVTHSVALEGLQETIVICVSNLKGKKTVNP